jgi:hypothetical protein
MLTTGIKFSAKKLMKKYLAVKQYLNSSKEINTTVFFSLARNVKENLPANCA